MARAGRKRKAGQRTKSGRLSRAGLAPYDHGTERAQAMKALYGDNWADAIDNAELSYSLRLTSLVDDVSTYKLTMAGFPDAEFEWIDDGHEEIRRRRRQCQARAVLTALMEPSETMLHSGGEVLRNSVFTRTMFAKAVWTAMITAALNEGEG